ncbi:hypothetical protein [Aeromonas phage Akh-2]|nr:hypothetical protein [Aeromonas phage Akh-2]
MSNSINNWGTVKGESQSEGLNYAKLVAGTPFVCRIVSGVRPRYQYWVHNSIGQKLPFESLSFNHENEKWIRGAIDPVREKGFTESDGKGGTKPLSSKRAYACVVINRATGQLEALDLKKSIFDGIIKYMQDSDENYANPSEIEFVIDKTGVKWNEVKYNINVMATLKANRDKEAVKALHEQDAKLLEGMKDIMEYWPRITAEEQRAALDEFLSRTADDSNKSANSGGNSGGDEEAMSDLD